ncbi:GNAT family N-acetyltransferase [Pseudomonas parafulva]|uniref:GNAT family N-acetyltransferase n=1 Tax=Pseudomonas parafulva TaxID=157782 RepID=A0AAI8KBI9_9PSED|nr:GNAT family N-acetyltransferase [Pseudomonas parafulva]AXO88551.1 GNAT family N-acetyltransferase [Pseudomonas parafulva]
MIRPAVPEDAAAIARVHIRSWQQAYHALMPEDYLRSLDDTLVRRTGYWRSTLDEGREQVLVAIVEGQVVGWIAYGASRDEDAIPGHTGEITAVYLLAEHWGTGVGRALWIDARAALIAREFSTLTLWVLAANTRAITFYRKVGLTAEPESARKLSRGGRTLEEVRYHTPL